MYIYFFFGFFFEFFVFLRFYILVTGQNVRLGCKFNQLSGIRG